jgi:NPCBM-associated, NEW3 domain of alpha-galactosidase
MMRAWLILCLLTAAAAAQPNRVLKTIDFEERQLGNNEDLPMHWIKISGAGLPHYVNGYLSNDRAHSGQYSFRFDLNGGSLVYRYDPMQLPVLVGARYHVECYCQTTVLPSARARLTAYFTDIDGHPLSSAIVQSHLYAAQADGEGWQKLSVDLNADDPKAAYLAVELGLLQPALYAPSLLGDHTLFPQDIHGSAWFDDVTIAQVPQVTLSSDRPGNVFRQSDPPQLSVVVNDLFTDDLQARLTLTNSDGVQVHQRSGAMDLAGAVNLGPTRKRLFVPLPHLPTGWYRAALEMTSHGRDLGEQMINLIQLADDGDTATPDPRFGVIATDLPDQQLDQLPLILPLLAAGRVKVAVWNSDHNVAEADAGEFDSLLEHLQYEGITPTGCLVALPPALAQSVGGPSWLKLLDAPADAWQPQLAYLISRHANHLDRWQLGTDDSDAFVTNSRMRQVYQLVYEQFAVLMHNPDLAMPWPAWYDLGQHLPATVALSVPVQVLPRQIPLYMRDLLSQSAEHNFSLTLQLLDNRYGREVRLRDLAQRVIFSLAGGAKRIDLPLPFTLESHGGSLSLQPQEDFIIDRTLMRLLGGAVFKGKTPVAEGVDAMLFDRGGLGILALWSRSAVSSSQHLTLALGPEPLKVDLWGNVTPLTPVNNAVSVDVGPMPFFLVGVDTAAAELRSSLVFDQPLLESSFQSHDRKLSFVNASRTTLSGSLRLRPPPGWAVTPMSFQFALNPGQSFSREVTIEFPYNSVAGKKTISADFIMDGDNGANFTVPMTLTLGLSDVGMQSLALRDGKDLIVQEMITNYSEQPIDYTAYAAYPGQARQERLINDLDAGRSTIKLYRFKNVKFVPGATVRCGLRQLQGTRVLNDEVAIQ